MHEYTLITPNGIQQYQPIYITQIYIDDNKII